MKRVGLAIGAAAVALAFFAFVANPVARFVSVDLPAATLKGKDNGR